MSRFSTVGELKVVSVPLDELTRHPENANEGDVDAIKESMTVNGYYSPVIAQASTGYILAGNHRWEAALALGADEIPTIFLDVDDETAKRIMVADNRTTRLGRDNPADLLALLDELSDSDYGLMGTGYSSSDHRLLVEAMNEDLNLDVELRAAEQATSGSASGLEGYDVMPVIDSDGLCAAVRIVREDGEAVSSAAFNEIRKAVGLNPLAATVLSQFGVDGW